MTQKEFKALDEDFEVCLCNGITLGEILIAINNGHNTIEALMEETDAGTSCELCQSREIDEDDEKELHLDEILKFSKQG
ncbi:MAG: (2Fe-2S)-binding protein [Campylobacterota bacterium]|nr:(2Fe-2S)-binding protein [Campylobacterota bacterium]